MIGLQANGCALRYRVIGLGIYRRITIHGECALFDIHPEYRPPGSDVSALRGYAQTARAVVFDLKDDRIGDADKTESMFLPMEVRHASGRR